MFFLFLTGIFCIGLAFFLYLSKKSTKIQPDYSYIIFKDYSSKELEPEILSANKEAKVEEPIEEKDLQEQQIEKPEDTPIPTLNFED
jgi:hypothetical protein